MTEHWPRVNVAWVSESAWASVSVWVESVSVLVWVSAWLSRCRCGGDRAGGLAAGDRGAGRVRERDEEGPGGGPGRLGVDRHGDRLLGLARGEVERPRGGDVVAAGRRGAVGRGVGDGHRHALGSDRLTVKVAVVGPVGLAVTAAPAIETVGWGLGLSIVMVAWRRGSWR